MRNGAAASFSSAGRAWQRTSQARSPRAPSDRSSGSRSTRVRSRGSMRCCPPCRCRAAFLLRVSPSERPARGTRAISPPRSSRSPTRVSPESSVQNGRRTRQRSRNRMRGSQSNALADHDVHDAPADALRVAVAARVIRSGGVVAHATEGVWGLGCDPFVRGAVERVLELKGRSWQKGLIVIGSDVDTFAPELAGLDSALRADIAGCWPGAITWVVPNVRFPRWITGRHSTVAIRVPAHLQALRLCRAVGGPIVSTSANPSGRPPARSALAVRGYFGNAIDAVLAGAIGGRGGPSEIRVALTGAALR